jgi:hypothetical protein
MAFSLCSMPLGGSIHLNSLYPRSARRFPLAVNVLDLHVKRGADSRSRPPINDSHRLVRKPRHYLFLEEFQGSGRDHRVHPRKL